MRALSVRQPWADLIIRGEKRIETRSWRTRRHDTRLWIHASRVESLDGWHLISSRGLDAEDDPLVFGALIGYVTFMGCIRVEDVRDSITAAEREAGDFSDGRWGWLFANPIRVEPRRLRGRLGLWETYRAP